MESIEHSVKMHFFFFGNISHLFDPKPEETGGPEVRKQFFLNERFQIHFFQIQFRRNRVD